MFEMKKIPFCECDEWKYPENSSKRNSFRNCTIIIIMVKKMKNNIYSRRLGQGDNCSLYVCSGDGVYTYTFNNSSW